MLPILTDTVVIVRAAVVTGYGNARTLDWEGAARVAVRGSVQPQSSIETTGARDRTATTCRVFLPRTADIRSTDRIEWGGGVWEVEGDPSRWPDPFGGGVHHIELTMSRTLGG